MALSGSDESERLALSGAPSSCRADSVLCRCWRVNRITEQGSVQLFFWMFFYISELLCKGEILPEGRTDEQEKTLLNKELRKEGGGAMRRES
jgi:hypothetical protein